MMTESSGKGHEKSGIGAAGNRRHVHRGHRDQPEVPGCIPALLLGLQHLYVTPELRRQVFALLEVEVNPEVRRDTGRPGMNLWSMLVLAVLRQGLGCDFDRLAHLANHDGLVRQMMGHGCMEHRYELQTVIDNVCLLGPELLTAISALVVQSGHAVAGKKPGEPLRGRADSFCVETDVHYPT